MLEPDATRVASTHTAPANVRPGSPDALQILTTEHWSLLASRCFVYTGPMSRTSIFIAALTSSVVALALVAQATDFGTGFARSPSCCSLSCSFSPGSSVPNAS